MSQAATNQLPYPIRGLVWKEARQIFPLIAMLLAIAALMVILESASTNVAISSYIPIAIPALYAVGAGAILVGHEKETRTMQWCSSLPIAPSQIVTMKYIVALLGLVLIWVLSLLIQQLSSWLGATEVGWMLWPGKMGLAGLVSWFLHSVFLLCCSIFMTWWLKNTFAALIALIPIAALPYLASQLVFPLFNGGRDLRLEDSSTVQSLQTLVGIVVFAAMGYRTALHHLSPARGDVSHDSAKWLTALRPTVSGVLSESPFRLSLSSLVWQSIRHNPVALSLLFMLMMLGTMCIMYSFVDTTATTGLRGFLHGGILGLFLGCSWLGVLVFNGDGNAARMRFLADRGVSPTIAWLGRQLIGLSLIAFSVLLYTACTYWLCRESLDGKPALSMLTFGLLLFAIYSISQWVSQSIRILAASAVAAPVVSIVFLVWIGTSVEIYESPWWTIAICLILPMLATWAMMRRYMDNHYRWPIWATGLVVACLLSTLPILPYAIEVWTWPRISKESRTELMAEAMRLPEPPIAQKFTFGSDGGFNPGFDNPNIESEALAWLQKQRDLPENVFSFGDSNIDSTTPLENDRHVFWFGFETAEYTRLKLRSNPQDAEAINLLGQWIRTYAVIAKRMRLSDRWMDQESADTAEIWLTAVLSDPQMKDHLDRDFAQVAIDAIADAKTRNESRRRAVLASWRENIESESLLLKDQKTSIQDKYAIGGGFDLSRIFELHREPKLSATWNLSRDTLVATALRYIEIGSSGQDTEAIRREMHNLVRTPEIPFDLGPYSDGERSTGSLDYPTYFHNKYHVPASQWFAPWETVAAQLKSSNATGEN